MRSYALFLALAVLHARAATIPAPETEKKIPIGHDALDDVSLDNNESEQELVKPTDTVKDIENNLRNSIPENVPVKVIEEQPIIKAIPLKEDSNDYVPDNDDSTNIKRVEIDLKNPGPPQRQEHDSQKPVTYHSYIDKDRAVAAIKQSIAESQNIFNSGLQDVTQKFKSYFANNDELNEVSNSIQNVRQNFNAEVVKLSNTINSYLKPERESEGAPNVEIPSNVKEVENRIKTLETNFNYGVDMLSEGVELLSILKEEDEQSLKIAGKADNANTATATQSPSTGTAPANTGSYHPTDTNAVVQFVQFLNTSMILGMNNLQNAMQNFFNPNQNVQQQGSAPAGVQADVPASTEIPNLLQQFQSNIQNFWNRPSDQQQTQPQPNPVIQYITSLFPAWPQQTPQQTNQANTASSPPIANAPAAQGTNSVPAAPAPVEPAKPAKESEQIESAPVQAPVQSVPAQSGPIQQMVQNNPIVKGITGAVQKIQGLSNPSKPRDSVVENTDFKGHGGGSGDTISGVGDMKNTPVKEQPEKIPEIQDGGEPSPELNKTE